MEFKSYRKDPKKPHSLRSSNISSLLADPGDPNLLWIGTKGGGLACMDIRSGNMVKSLTKKEGLPDDVVYGILTEYPGHGAESDNPVKPRVFITGLKINDRPVSVRDSSGILTKAVEFTEAITTPYSQNSISFEFASLEFSAPSKNRYRYWLKGFEMESAHICAVPGATYIGLPPGSHVFHSLWIQQ